MRATVAAAFTENMRVAADHFRCDGFGDVWKSKQAFLFRHARMIDDLQQEIAEFVL